MASGSQTYSGIWADLPVAPTNNSRQIAVTVLTGSAEAWAWISLNDRVQTPFSPQLQNNRNSPRRNPASPTRLTTKAFLPALAFSSSVYQKPISMYEHNPTPSQPTNSRRRFSPRTNSNIAAVNRLR